MQAKEINTSESGLILYFELETNDDGEGLLQPFQQHSIETLKKNGSLYHLRT